MERIFIKMISSQLSNLNSRDVENWNRQNKPNMHQEDINAHAVITNRIHAVIIIQIGFQT